MATAIIIKSSAPYYTVRVEFGNNVFEQQIVSLKTGAALKKQVDSYATDYERNWLDNQPHGDQVINGEYVIDTE
jgi:hypothetical protein